MRMKRLISSVVLAVMLCLPMLADSYHDALVQYMSGSDAVDMSKYSHMLQPMAEKVFPGDKKAARAFTEYMTTQMILDIVDIYEPSFRKYVSQEELNELINLYSDPKYATLNKRWEQVVSDSQHSTEYQVFVLQLSQGIQEILQDKPAQDLQMADDVSKEYSDVFYQYFSLSGIDEMLRNVYRSVLSDMIQQYDVSNPQAKMDEVLDYAIRNVPKVLLSMCQNVLTIDDLRLLITLSENPAYRHSQQAIAEGTSNVMAMAVTLIRKMAEWMEVHYPKYAAPLNQTLQVLGQ